MAAAYRVDADELATATEGATDDGTVIAAYQGDAVPMSAAQFARLVKAASGGMVVGRQAVLRAIGAEDGDDAHH